LGDEDELIPMNLREIMQKNDAKVRY
jgi:hypothetical protein